MGSEHWKGGLTVDWNKLKAEYIAGGTSYRKLAEKYGVSRRTVECRGKEENWCELKRQNCEKTVAKIVEAVADTKVDIAVEAATLGRNASLYMLRQIEQDSKTGLLKDTQISSYPRAIEQIWKNLGITAEQPSDEKEINVIMGSEGDDYSV